MMKDTMSINTWRFGIMENIKGFIFDMDGVLTETSENHYLAWQALAEELGITIDRSLNEQLKGVSRMDSLNIILNHGGLENKFSEEEKIALATKKNNHYVSMIEKFTPDNLLEGVRPFLEELRSKNIKIGVASASRSAVKLLNLLGIADLVDYVVDPTTVASKPSPEIFLAAAKGLGLEPGECIGVEDAAAGIASIKSAGMYAIGIGRAQDLPQADTLYQSPKELSQFII